MSLQGAYASHAHIAGKAIAHAKRTHRQWNASSVNLGKSMTRTVPATNRRNGGTISKAKYRWRTWAAWPTHAGTSPK